MSRSGLSANEKGEKFASNDNAFYFYLRFSKCRPHDHGVLNNIVAARFQSADCIVIPCVLHFFFHH